MNQPRAIIVGSGGQDGKLLEKYLLEKNYALTLVTRQSHDITDPAQIEKLVQQTAPAEIYYLAACHHSSEMQTSATAELLAQSFAVNTVAWGYFLAATLLHQKNCRLFYAGSSHIFPANQTGLIDENSQPAPNSVYGISKQAGMELCRHYREKHSLHASCGILFNHESAHRPASYLSKKIATAAARAARGHNVELRLGNLEAVADWGAAEDYVSAMHTILQTNPDDYIVATGTPHSVRQFAEAAFAHVGLDYKKYISEDAGLLTKPIERRIGNAGKLTAATGWKPSISFTQMIHKLVDFELAAAA